VEEPEKKRRNRFWPNVDGRIFEKNLVPRTNREEMVRAKSEAVGDNCCAAVRGPVTRPLVCVSKRARVGALSAELGFRCAGN
jgi:hypothetical protein